MRRKTIVELILHLGFWIITLYFFTTTSFLRFPSSDTKVEYYSLSLIISIIYINYFWLIPHYFTREHFYKYFLLLFSFLVLIAFLEFLMLKNDINIYTKTLDKVTRAIVFRWNSFGILFRDFLFVAFFTMFKIYRDAIKANKLLKQINTLEQQKMRSEINMVKSKVNSHFFFNTLNCIYLEALERTEKTSEMIIMLSDLMHYVVADSEHEWVPLQKEIEFLKNYSTLEQSRHNDLALTFRLKGDMSNIMVPPMIFEAFVNNAFKYTNNEGKGYIHIHLDCNIDNTLVFSCENNTRTTTDTTVISTGKGLRNTNDRLKLFYDNKHQLETSLENGIYRVRLVLESVKST